ncbi:hypothetical protein J3R30DRAFT_1139214 [Lentinula aciculospora]|uniref:Uncharacterized protein n=1 Tax=Lentinula aciculospora TaxID=153920 RepID=A0A9W8ZZH7_9AGAR|nr:hypothetical protein J3R30DRAFT_1139214 [Lentinula aciculospora]
MTLSSQATLSLLLTTCCMVIARFWGLFYIQLSPLSITISPFRLSSSSRHLAVGKTCIFFHIPHRERPQWASVSIHNINYRSVESQHFTIAEASLFFFFPFSLLVETKPRPAPISLSLHDFCLRIPSSHNTPSWLVALRRNILYTILNEETQRLDEFRLKIVFSTLTLQQQQSNQNEGQSSEDVKDESRITHHSSQWHIHNRATFRLYRFGRLAAQLRRTWKDDTGTFALVAEDCHWTRHSRFEENDIQSKQLFIHLTDFTRAMISYIMRIPAVLSTLYKCPSSIYSVSYLVDIHISRTDITFDCFNLSDAEPLRHGAELFRRNLDEDISIWSGFVSDRWVSNLISAAMRL